MKRGRPALARTSGRLAAKPFCRHDDSIRGGDRPDFLLGEVGRDEIAGEAGNDKLYGNGGDDVLWGDAKELGSETQVAFCSKLPSGCTLDVALGVHDIIGGGNGADRLHAGLGDNSLYGGAGDDRLIGSMCRDESCPGAFAGPVGNFFESRSFHNDYLSGEEGDDYLNGAFFQDIYDGGLSEQDVCVPDSHFAGNTYVGCELAG